MERCVSVGVEADMARFATAAVGNVGAGVGRASYDEGSSNIGRRGRKGSVGVSQAIGECHEKLGDVAGQKVRQRVIC